MTTVQAKKQAKKVFGSNGYISWNPKAPDESAKENLRIDLKEAKASRDTCDKADKTAYAERNRRVNEITGLLLSYRASVGYLVGVGGIVFFNVQGQGDTFEKAFESAALRTNV